MQNKTYILDSNQTKKKINRIAYQILELYYNENKIIFAGISKRGFLLAKEIHEIFNS